MKGGSGLMKTTIFFIIDEEGKTSNFRTEGENEIFNKEALRTIIASTQNVVWEPAINNNKPVKYMFKMPITMNFE